MLLYNQAARMAKLEQLAEEASRRWPGATEAVALDRLYREIFRELLMAQHQGEDTTMLEADLLLVLGERDRLLRQGSRQQLSSLTRPKERAQQEAENVTTP
ncbi:MAG: hypothetical protein ACRDGA_03100 [Bacteroidota bacterium]